MRHRLALRAIVRFLERHLSLFFGTAAFVAYAMSTEILQSFYSHLGLTFQEIPADPKLVVLGTAGIFFSLLILGVILSAAAIGSFIMTKSMGELFVDIVLSSEVPLLRLVVPSIYVLYIAFMVWAGAEILRGPSLALYLTIVLFMIIGLVWPVGLSLFDNTPSAKQKPYNATTSDWSKPIVGWIVVVVLAVSAVLLALTVFLFDLSANEAQRVQHYHAVNLPGIVIEPVQVRLTGAPLPDLKANDHFMLIGIEAGEYLLLDVQDPSSPTLLRVPISSVTLVYTLPATPTSGRA